jgi:hypothetical protein
MGTITKSVTARSVAPHRTPRLVTKPLVAPTSFATSKIEMETLLKLKTGLTTQTGIVKLDATSYMFKGKQHSLLVSNTTPMYYYSASMQPSYIPSLIIDTIAITSEITSEIVKTTNPGTIIHNVNILDDYLGSTRDNQLVMKPSGADNSGIFMGRNTYYNSDAVNSVVVGTSTRGYDNSTVIGCSTDSVASNTVKDSIIFGGVTKPGNTGSNQLVFGSTPAVNMTALESTHSILVLLNGAKYKILLNIP